MKRIPSSFQIGSLTFKVTRVTSEEMEKRAGLSAYGLFLPDSQEILVEKAGKGCSAELAKQSFFHELSHAILWVMAHKDYKNEKIVDQLGHILKQFDDTAK
jgi:N-methylhydantoinase A/oxoprolinase/acetone carboxylase beta subunit